MKKTITAGFLVMSLLSLPAQIFQMAGDSSANTNKLDMVEIIKKPQPFTNSVGMAMIPVNGFWAGKFEVTQAAYQEVMKSNPSRTRATNNPVDSVSWNDAINFCEKLTMIERKESNLPTNYIYTLPTEAQWTTLVADASLDDAVTSAGGVGSSRNGPTRVGSLKPNSLGLYDTRGNVMEFTLDWHDPNQTYRVLKGGAFDTWYEPNLRTVFRHYATGPDDAQPDYGFRCVLEKQTVPAR